MVNTMMSVIVDVIVQYKTNGCEKNEKSIMIAYIEKIKYI